jgi:hypothetical protein
MESTPFELTPEQKGLLESLARETGMSVASLIAKALARLQEDVRPYHVNSETNSGDAHASAYRYKNRVSPFGNTAKTPATRFLKKNSIASQPISPRRSIIVFTIRRNGNHAAFISPNERRYLIYD